MGVSIRMDSEYIMLRSGSERDRRLDAIMGNVEKASKAGVKVITHHWTVIPIRRRTSHKVSGNETSLLVWSRCPRVMIRTAFCPGRRCAPEWAMGARIRPSRAISDIELSRSAAVVWLVRTPTFLRLKGGGMANESPP